MVHHFFTLIREFYMDCLPQIAVYQQQIEHELPGNASSASFNSCALDKRETETELTAVLDVRLKQKACAFGRCHTTWAYNSSVHGMIVLDGQCQLLRLEIRPNPLNAIIDGLVQKADEAIRNRLSDVLAKNPDLAKECMR